MSHDMYKLYNEVEIYTTVCRRHEVVYTLETETNLYNRLVPWGIATLKLEINIIYLHNKFLQKVKGVLVIEGDINIK